MLHMNMLIVQYHPSLAIHHVIPSKLEREMMPRKMTYAARPHRSARAAEC